MIENSPIKTTRGFTEIESLTGLFYTLKQGPRSKNNLEKHHFQSYYNWWQVIGIDNRSIKQNKVSEGTHIHINTYFLKKPLRELSGMMNSFYLDVHGDLCRDCQILLNWSLVLPNYIPYFTYVLPQLQQNKNKVAIKNYILSDKLLERLESIIKLNWNFK